MELNKLTEHLEYTSTDMTPDDLEMYTGIDYATIMQDYLDYVNDKLKDGYYYLTDDDDDTEEIKSITMEQLTNELEKWADERFYESFYDDYFENYSLSVDDFTTDEGKRVYFIDSEDGIRYSCLSFYEYNQGLLYDNDYYYVLDYLNRDNGEYGLYRCKKEDLDIIIDNELDCHEIRKKYLIL